MAKYTNKTLQEAATGVVIDVDGTRRTYNVGFNDGDEAQFDVETFTELKECWEIFCKEEKINTDCVDYVDYVGTTADCDDGSEE